jgi:hypothetical protein
VKKLISLVKLGWRVGQDKEGQVFAWYRYSIPQSTTNMENLVLLTTNLPYYNLRNFFYQIIYYFILPMNHLELIHLYPIG